MSKKNGNDHREAEMERKFADFALVPAKPRARGFVGLMLDPAGNCGIRVSITAIVDLDDIGKAG